MLQWSFLLFWKFDLMSDDCNHPLGMSESDKRIPDESITSSSKLSSNHGPSNARLDGPRAWCSALDDNSPYIQIRFVKEKLITAIETQGSAPDNSWSTKYDVHYLKKGKWTLYKEVIWLSTAFYSLPGYISRICNFRSLQLITHSKNENFL